MGTSGRISRAVSGSGCSVSEAADEFDELSSSVGGALVCSMHKHAQK